MSDNIAWLIQDIGKLDGHRRNMMEELKVLRDITMFYNERHPELHAAGTRKEPTEDNIPGSARQQNTTAPPTNPDHRPRTRETTATYQEKRRGRYDKLRFDDGRAPRLSVIIKIILMLYIVIHLNITITRSNVFNLGGRCAVPIHGHIDA